MTLAEALIGIIALAASGGVGLYLLHMLRSGRDSFEDPELAKETMRTAPYHRLGNVMTRTG